MDRLPEDVRTLLQVLHDHGFEAYVVGGCVRDSLLSLEPHDWDITTNALPEETIKLFEFLNLQVIKTGLKHGTVAVFMNGETYEITTYRVDGNYTDLRHPDTVKFVSSLEEDLKRRDFTINAMAYNEEEGLIDLFGGQKDLNDRIIRCVGSPYDRFNEDPLRMLRAIRFGANLNFILDKKINDAIRRQEKLILSISKERITSEFEKMLVSNNKNALRYYLDRYERIFAIICPPLYEMFDYNQNNKYHDFSLWEHTVRTIINCPNNYMVRLAALFHDIGKPSCYKEDKEGWGHYKGHALASVKIFEDICNNKYFVFSTLEKKTISELILFHDYNLVNTNKCLRKFLSKIDIKNLDWIIKLKEADCLSHKENDEEAEKKFEELQKIEAAAKSIIITPRANCFSLKDLDINGKQVIEIMKLDEGDKVVGNILKRCLKLVIDGAIKNDYNVFKELIIKDKLFSK